MTTSTTSSSQVALSSDINQTQLTNHIPEILKRAAEAKNLGDKRAIFEGVYSEIQQISQKRALEAPLASAFFALLHDYATQTLYGQVEGDAAARGDNFCGYEGYEKSIELAQKAINPTP